MSKCFCGVPATQGTVAKEGANKGRTFLRCSRWPTNHCSFFQWGAMPCITTAPEHPATDSSQWGYTPKPLAPQPVTPVVDVAKKLEQIAALEERVKAMETHLCYLMARDEVIKKAYQ